MLHYMAVIELLAHCRLYKTFFVIFLQQYEKHVTKTELYSFMTLLIV